MTTAAQTNYTREIKAPADMTEGLANFVQIIINQIERGDVRNALLSAVDLHQDITTGVYGSVTAPKGEGYVPMDEHFRAVEAARVEASDKAMKAGANAVRAELNRLLGRTPA